LELLPLFALIGTVVLHTTLNGTLFAVGLSATKRTTQVNPLGIAMIGDEKNPAMSAAVQTFT